MLPCEPCGEKHRFHSNRVLSGLPRRSRQLRLFHSPPPQSSPLNRERKNVVVACLILAMTRLRFQLRRGRQTRLDSGSSRRPTVGVSGSRFQVLGITSNTKLQTRPSPLRSVAKSPSRFVLSSPFPPCPRVAASPCLIYPYFPKSYAPLLPPRNRCQY